MATKSIIREGKDVFICVEGRMTQIGIEDIIYIEHNSRTVFIYTIRGIIYIPYITLERIYDTLGTDYLFQCHKSFLVNRIFIERIDRTQNYIVLKNFLGHVAIGRKYKTELLQEMHLIERGRTE